MTPFIACLCPTYNRPKHLLPNAAACFLTQAYPGNRRKLFILDDSNQWDRQQITYSNGAEIEVRSFPERLPSLSAKYNLMAMQAIHEGFDMLAIWEDDEIYLPDYLLSHALALEIMPDSIWSKPSSVYTAIPEVRIEPATGRFHASLLLRNRAYFKAGGWPDTNRADYDLQFIGNLQRRCGAPADPIRCQTAFGGKEGMPQYIFRWGSSQAYHGQAFGKGPADETWYNRVPQPDPKVKHGHLTPQFDEDTKEKIAGLGLPVPEQWWLRPASEPVHDAASGTAV